MLSAQKQKTPQDTATENSRTPASGFGKVLTSIQGLQQRLDDFSVDEVTRAHVRAGDLIQQLGELQTRLRALAELKNTFADAKAMIEALTELKIDLGESDDVENHPHVRAVVEAGKLIRAHRLMKAAEASAESRSFELPENAADRTVGPKQTNGTAAEAPLPVIALQEPNHGAEVKVSREMSPGFTLIDQPYETGATKAAYDFADSKLEETPRTSATGAQHKEHQATTNTAKKKATGNTPFNERLLSDLIDTYGEFVSTKPEPLTERRPEKSEALPLEEAAPRSTTVSESALSTRAATSMALVIVDAPRDIAPMDNITAPEPAFVEPITSSQFALPAPEQEINEPGFEQSIPNAKARGEIDQQLKSIIKDYGQVDLYSHGKPMNTKVTAIAAAALLALVLGGIFFFKAPSTIPSTPVEAGNTVDSSSSNSDIKK